MNNKVNYSLVGFLMICAIFLMLGFAYWLLKPSKDIEMMTYAIHFEESVLGLNFDAPVKYRGISVGKVTKLSINPNNSEEVIVLISVLDTTPIKTSTMAQLTSQGITGLSYINLSFGDDSAPLLKKEKGQAYPTIKTIPSLLIKLENTLNDITLNLSETLQRLSGALKEENQNELTLLLKNSNVFISKLNKALDNKTIEDFQATMRNLNSASEKLDKIFPRVEKFINNSIVWEDKISSSFDSISNSYLGIKDSMDAFKGAVQNGEFNIKDISNDILPTLNNTLLEMQNLTIKIEETLRVYERSPADVLFLQEQIKKGPGEK